jgi:hypothetical protein
VGNFSAEFGFSPSMTVILPGRMFLLAILKKIQVLPEILRKIFSISDHF